VTVALELLKLAAVGLIAGLFTSMLTSRDHRQRRWWEMRVAAYQSAIESLSDLAYFYREHFISEISGLAIPQEKQEELAKSWNESMHKVRRFADSGAFLFSERADLALRQFLRRAYLHSTLDQFNANIDHSATCLRELVACSKVDLKLRDGAMRLG
jgi:aminopeptidase N